MKKNKTWKKWNNSDKEYILNNTDKTNRELAGALNRTAQSIESFKTANNIRCTAPTYNISFFEKWSYDLAYFLGFLISDGYLIYDKNRRFYRASFEIHISDQEILHNIRSMVDPLNAKAGVKYRKRYRKEFNITSEYVIYSIYSKSIVDILMQNYGVATNKTGKEIVPPNIPKEFFGSFLCGLFDGDGHVDKEGKRVSIFSASEVFLKEIYDFLGYGYIRKNKTCYGIHFENKNSVSNFRDLIYSNIDYSLSRKKGRFSHD